MKPSCMVVLAGGFGTRLRSVVTELPKALAPIGSTPFLRLQLENWRAQGISSFVFSLHHQADRIIDFLDREKVLLDGCMVHCVTEPEPLDTGGAVAYVTNTQNLQGDFLVANADTWLSGGVVELCSATAPALAAVSLADTSRYGRLQTDAGAFVTGFLEKGMSGRGWINAGLYHLSAADFRQWDGKPFSLERHWFPRLMQRGTLKAVPLKSDFIDIGVPDDYFRFCRWVETGRKEMLCS